jgi:cytochrome c oxidase cbb3-type subunit I/II
MVDPRSVSPGSIMPPFPDLVTAKVDASKTPDKMRALRSVGVPYTAEAIGSAQADEATQAKEIADGLRNEGATEATPGSELVALVAYLQRLGVHPQPPAPAQNQVSLR